MEGGKKRKGGVNVALMIGISTLFCGKVEGRHLIDSIPDIGNGRASCTYTLY